jgi:rod shape-determining protein MreC
MVISITVIAVDLLGIGPVNFVRDGVNGALSPVRSLGDALFGDEDSEQVQELEQRVAELEVAEIEAANYLAELRRLQEVQGLAIDSEYLAISANVISREIGNFDASIEIDRGADAGIEVGMPVRTTALVGVVDQVTFTSARVRLITDPTVTVGVLHSPTGEVGVAEGQGPGESLVVQSGFDAATRVANEDPFVTAGPDGSNYPPGMVVGRAVRVQGGTNPLEQEVFIEPTADLDGLTQVAVVLFTPTQGGRDAEGEGQAG